MNDKNGFVITDRDRVLLTWESLTEVVRDCRTYSEENEDGKRLSELFDDIAEGCALYAAKLVLLLRQYDENG